MISDTLGFKLNTAKEIVSSINKFELYTFSNDRQRKQVALEILEAAKNKNVVYNRRKAFYMAAGVGVNRWI